MKNIDDIPDAVFNSKHLFRKIKWWQKLLLPFKKTYIGYDLGFGQDKTCVVYAKRLFGKTFIMDIE